MQQYFPSVYDKGYLQLKIRQVHYTLEIHWVLLLNHPLERRGGWENNFPIKWINRLILKGARAQLNGIGIQISLFSLLSNKNSSKYYFVVVDVDVLFLLMVWNVQDLINSTDHPNRYPLDIRSLSHRSNLIFLITHDLRTDNLSVWVIGCFYTLLKKSNRSYIGF